MDGLIEPQTEQPRFVKVLGRSDVLVLGFGAMIGWSWVLMTGHWVQTAGSLGTLLAFAAGGFAITLIGLTYSELASAMPKAGGEHVYTEKGLGRNWSFVCTWALLFAYVNVCLFESVALPTALEYLIPQLRLGTLWQVLDADVDAGFILVGIVGTLLVTWINVRGIKTAARFQTAVIVLIVVAGLLLITGAISFGSLANAKPWIATPATGILSVLIMVPAMLVGFDVIPQSAEEIDLPPQQIGRLLIVSMILAVFWYGAISFGVATALNPEALANSSMATGDAASALWGSSSAYPGSTASWAGQLLVLGGVGGILTSWNAFVVGGSRVLFALAESGQIPGIFSRLHPKHNTPYVGIIFIGVLSCLSPLFGRTIMVWLIDAGSFATVIAYLFVPMAFLALRKKQPELPRPFRVRHPNLVGWSAILMALALLSFYLPWSPSALIWPQEWLLLLIWAILGGLLLLFYRGGRRPVE